MEANDDVDNVLKRIIPFTTITYWVVNFSE